MAQPRFKQIKDKATVNQLDISGASAGTDPASRDFVTAQIQGSVLGKDFKDSVRVASTGNVSLSAPGATIDGINLTNGDRILLKNQTTASQNGIYVFATSSTALVRSTDANTSAKVTSQLAVSVEEGTTNGNTTWKLTTSGAITLDTTALSFALFSTSYYATPTHANKYMTASVTAVDGDLATATVMAATPALNSFVNVEVNGWGIDVGDGVKMLMAYFSADNGTTAKARNAIAAGDKLYWVGSKAGYQLDANDTVTFDYVV